MKKSFKNIIILYIIINIFYGLHFKDQPEILISIRYFAPSYPFYFIAAATLHYFAMLLFINGLGDFITARKLIIIRLGDRSSRFLALRQAILTISVYAFINLSLDYAIVSQLRLAEFGVNLLILVLPTFILFKQAKVEFAVMMIYVMQLFSKLAGFYFFYSNRV